MFGEKDLQVAGSLSESCNKQMLWSFVTNSSDAFMMGFLLTLGKIMEKQSILPTSLLKTKHGITINKTL